MRNWLRARLVFAGVLAVLFIVFVIYLSWAHPTVGSSVFGRLVVAFFWVVVGVVMIFLLRRHWRGD